MIINSTASEINQVIGVERLFYEIVWLVISDIGNDASKVKRVRKRIEKNDAVTWCANL